MGSGGKPYTVLIVDDNAELLEFITDTLHELGEYTVVTASDGVEALQRYYTTQPDCLVIDVKMPRLDGYQLVRALRGDATSAQTPLIMLSAMAQDRDQLAGMLAGADQYLLKPVDPLALVEAVERAIRVGADERAERLLRLAQGGDALPGADDARSARVDGEGRRTR
ncbi:MAG: response regulator [Ktedonobacterales bacterium]